MHEVALPPNVAQIPANAVHAGAAELGARPGALSEVTIRTGLPRDCYVTVPVQVLTTLNKLVLDGRVYEFRKFEEGIEALMWVRASQARSQKAWQFVFNREAQRVWRYTEVGGLVNVVLR